MRKERSGLGVFALNGSPGHHAERDSGGGYCIFNNGGLMVNELVQLLGPNKRVGMLDLDYHAGDGQQTIFYDRDDVVTVSLHANPRDDYPSFRGFEDETGEGNGKGYNLNICLPKGTTGQEYLQALETRALSFLKECKIDALIICFGADTFINDPDPSNLSGFKLGISDYERIGAALRNCGWPMGVTQEGGYSKQVGEVVTSFLRGLTGGNNN